MNRPYQGVFVKNPEYVTEGRSDEYDFYFTDNQNHAIRKMTPEGIVSTFAGRGRSGQAADNNFWGTEDGDLREVARFRDPTGIAYDEESNTFYILDTVGRKIRTISMEKEDGDVEQPGDEIGIE
jgi:sugar lactone lactonase YvrE